MPRDCPQAHDTASFGDIAKLGSQLQKSGLVFDDILIETFHRILRGRGALFDGVLHFHQNGESLYFQGLLSDQVETTSFYRSDISRHRACGHCCRYPPPPALSFAPRGKARKYRAVQPLCCAYFRPVQLSKAFARPAKEYLPRLEALLEEIENNPDINRLL